MIESFPIYIGVETGRVEDRPLLGCRCERCVPMGNPFDGTAANVRMILCSTCGNKRCPHATDHRNACTGSNEPGQKGSSWENYPRFGEGDGLGKPAEGGGDVTVILSPKLRAEARGEK